MGFFDDNGIDLEEVFQAIVTGGNVLLREDGGKRTRRTVTGIQATLIRLLGETGKVELPVLIEAYPKQWKRITARNKGKYELYSRREFFRNRADVAARINGQLRAGYLDPELGKTVLALTGGRYLKIVFDWANFIMACVLEKDLEGYLQELQYTDRRRHVVLTGRKRRRPAGEAETHGAPHSPESHIWEKQENSPPGEVDSTVPGAEPPPTPEGKLEAEAVTLMDFREESLNGAWQFRLDGHQVEIRRDIGYVTVDGVPVKLPRVRSLERPEEIEGELLRLLRAVIGRLTAPGSANG